MAENKGFAENRHMSGGVYVVADSQVQRLARGRRPEKEKMNGFCCRGYREKATGETEAAREIPWIKSQKKPHYRKKARCGCDLHS